MTNEEKILEMLQQNGKLLEQQNKTLEHHGKDLHEIKNTQKKQGKKLDQVEKDIKFILKYHDDMHIRLRSRVEQLEKHTGSRVNDL